MRAVRHMCTHATATASATATATASATATHAHTHACMYEDIVVPTVLRHEYA